MSSDSLVIADLFELLGGNTPVQSDIPELMNANGVGATFRLYNPAGGGTTVGAPANYDLGTPQPTTDLVQSLLLDGERPFGYRASNRTITLPIIIRAPDYVTLAAAKELLMATVDAQTWTLSWTPASTGLTQVFDCFRALPTVNSYGFAPEAVTPIAGITLSFQALPYGRTDPAGQTTVNFASPLTGQSAPPPAVTLDNFSSVSGTNWTQSATQFVVGPHSARYTQPSANANVTAVYTRTGLSLSIAGLTALSVWFGQSFDAPHGKPWVPFASDVTLNWTLTDNSGHTLSFHVTGKKTPWSVSSEAPKWTRLTAAIPQGTAGFNYNGITAYKLVISNHRVSGGWSEWRLMNAWLDNIVANPPSISTPASVRGVNYNIMGVPGTARTPFSAQFQLPSQAVITQTLTGSTGLWWPPNGVTSVTAECVGAGGSGGARSTAGLGGGGGGGEYASQVLTVAAGTPVPYACGTGGQSGAAPVVVTFNQAGNGSWTCPAGVTAVKAECWGGGSGGAAGGGGGGGGEYAAEPAVAVTPGTSYPFTVGVGGLGGNWGLAGFQGAVGGTTTFAGDTPATAHQTVTANGGLTEKPGGTLGGVGGTGSANTTHHDGGAGGTSPSYGAGGGGGSGGSAAGGNTGNNASGMTGGTGATAVTGGGAGGNGASSPGWPTAGGAPGGGGGGGYTNPNTGVNNPGANGSTGQIVLTYTVASGSPVDGGSTTFGTYPGWTGASGTAGVTVTAHGGKATLLNSTTGGLGGTGSSATTHHDGGAGGLGGTNGGGGGGSGGSAATGTAGTAGASGGTGAPAVKGGGKGGNGATVANTVGLSGSAPGGGGGGADYSSGNAVAGGLGGQGSITLTHTPPLAPFGTLIVHRPGHNAPPSLNPCVPILNTADLPTGIEYKVPTLIAGQNALFDGTYSVIAVAYNWDNPTASRRMTITVNQYEYLGKSKAPFQTTINRTFTPATDIVNGIVMMGEMTLPVKDIDFSNTSGYFTVSITDTDLEDQFLDVLFIDTQGQTVIVNIPSGGVYTNFYIDEPSTDRDLGRILGSDLDRSQAVSVLDSAIPSGGPFYLDGGQNKTDNLLFAYSPSGAPSLGVTFVNRWFLERLVL